MHTIPSNPPANMHTCIHIDHLLYRNPNHRLPSLTPIHHILGEERLGSDALHPLRPGGALCSLYMVGARPNYTKQNKQVLSNYLNLESNTDQVEPLDTCFFFVVQR